MCVKEVEGTQGQESPYRQEKACGGGGGGGGSRLLSDSCLLNAHRLKTHRRGGAVLQSFLISRRARRAQKERGGGSAKHMQYLNSLEGLLYNIFLKGHSAPVQTIVFLSASPVGDSCNILWDSIGNNCSKAFVKEIRY